MPPPLPYYLMLFPGSFYFMLPCMQLIYNETPKFNFKMLNLTEARLGQLEEEKLLLRFKAHDSV